MLLFYRHGPVLSSASTGLVSFVKTLGHPIGKPPIGNRLGPSVRDRLQSTIVADIRSQTILALIAFVQWSYVEVRGVESVRTV